MIYPLVHNHFLYKEIIFNIWMVLQFLQLLLKHIFIEDIISYYICQALYSTMEVNNWKALSIRKPRSVARWLYGRMGLMCNFHWVFCPMEPATSFDGQCSMTQGQTKLDRNVDSTVCYIRASASYVTLPNVNIFIHFNLKYKTDLKLL